MPADQIGMYSRIPKSLDGLYYTALGRNLKVWYDFEDMLEGDNLEQGKWHLSTNGAGAYAQGTNPLNTRPGILVFSTGTTAAGRAGAYSLGQSQNGLCFGAGIYTIESDIYIPDLSTVAEEYIFRFGFGDTVTGDNVDGSYFEYDRLTNVNWQFCNASNSTRTKQDTGFTVNAGTWTRLKVVAELSLARFYINNFYIGASSGNFPLAGRYLASTINIIKSAGLTDRTFWCDWIWQHILLNASR